MDAAAVDRRPRREAQIDVLIAGLVSGLSVPDAAERAGMARSSAYEELDREDVRERLDRARAEVLGEAVRKSAALCGEALGTLAELMRGASSESVRERAATSLLSAARALKLDGETDERLRELGAALDSLGR